MALLGHDKGDHVRAAATPPSKRQSETGDLMNKWQEEEGSRCTAEEGTCWCASSEAELGQSTSSIYMWLGVLRSWL